MSQVSDVSRPKGEKGPATTTGGGTAEHSNAPGSDLEADAGRDRRSPYRGEATGRAGLPAGGREGHARPGQGQEGRLRARGRGPGERPGRRGGPRGGAGPAPC